VIVEVVVDMVAMSRSGVEVLVLGVVRGVSWMAWRRESFSGSGTLSTSDSESGAGGSISSIVSGSGSSI